MNNFILFLSNILFSLILIVSILACTHFIIMIISDLTPLFP